MKMKMEIINCPGCGKAMELVIAPLFNPYDDGVGWGEQFLYVCCHNSCPTYESFICISNSQGDVLDRRRGYLRNIFYPKANLFDEVRIGGFKIVTSEMLEIMNENLKFLELLKKISIKDEIDDKDVSCLLLILTNEKIERSLRLEAGNILEERAGCDAVDFICSHRSNDPKIAAEEDMIVKKIKQRFYVLCCGCRELIKINSAECVYCGEIARKD